MDCSVKQSGNICSVLKFLGIAQIVATVIMVIAAYNVEPGFSAIGSQLAIVANKCNQVIPEYRTMFEKSSASIVKQEANLIQTVRANDDIAYKLTSVGNTLEAKRGKFYWPDSLADIGADLKIYGNTVSSLSSGISEQVQILQQYKNVVFPMTLAVFDEFYELGKCAEQTSRNLSSGSHAALIITLLICGILFLLNGIGLLYIANYLRNLNNN